jgi:hypothetical protein
MSPIPRFETVRDQVDAMEPEIAAIRRMLTEAIPKRMTTRQVEAMLTHAEGCLATLYDANRKIVEWIDDVILCAVQTDPAEPLDKSQGAVAEIRSLLDRTSPE